VDIQGGQSRQALLTHGGAKIGFYLSQSTEAALSWGGGGMHVHPVHPPLGTQLVLCIRNSSDLDPLVGSGPKGFFVPQIRIRPMEYGFIVLNSCNS
jgi:hypothetical protein